MQMHTRLWICTQHTPPFCTTKQTALCRCMLGRAPSHAPTTEPGNVLMYCEAVACADKKTHYTLRGGGADKISDNTTPTHKRCETLRMAKGRPHPSQGMATHGCASKQPYASWCCTCTTDLEGGGAWSLQLCALISTGCRQDVLGMTRHHLTAAYSTGRGVEPHAGVVNPTPGLSPDIDLRTNMARLWETWPPQSAICMPATRHPALQLVPNPPQRPMLLSRTCQCCQLPGDLNHGMQAHSALPSEEAVGT
jgi:hypothetical protein